MYHLIVIWVSLLKPFKGITLNDTFIENMIIGSHLCEKLDGENCLKEKIKNIET